MNHLFIKNENKQWRVLAFYGLAVPSFLWALVTIWFLFNARFSYPGQVCAGLYLKSDEDDDGYLMDTSAFIIFFLIVCLILIIGGFLFTLYEVYQAYVRHSVKL